MTPGRTYDAIVVGGGAAGLSAALVLGRARRNVVVIDDGQPRNGVADRSHGYFTRDGERPAELLRIAREQLAAYPTVTLFHGAVSGVTRQAERFAVVTPDATWYSTKLLLATGVFDQLPEIDGLSQRWGKTIFVCPFCDGWEVRDTRIAVYAPDREAVDLAQELYGWSKDVIVCAERDNLTEMDRRWIQAAGVASIVGKLRSISGSPASNVLTFDTGTELECRALFISAPLRQHSPLYAQLGCAIGDDGLVVVDEHSRTTVPGCYAAGDSVTQRHQVVVAAASGASAAITLNCNLLEEHAQKLVASRSKHVSR